MYLSKLWSFHFSFILLFSCVKFSLSRGLLLTVKPYSHTSKSNELQWQYKLLWHNINSNIKQRSSCFVCVCVTCIHMHVGFIWKEMHTVQIRWWFVVCHNLINWLKNRYSNCISCICCERVLPILILTQLTTIFFHRKSVLFVAMEKS